ncbi:hypothetical protein XELAEV_18046708mg [Xenopus laevis]|uniref:Uncharacterized protein n=1 Tax=Xenopus laevis TaxID=8355 RepID=A0A974BU18_XENLA|nr:hypothetical protein XELAEV_18046708mg [Xenopus laevis]
MRMIRWHYKAEDKWALAASRWENPELVNGKSLITLMEAAWGCVPTIQSTAVLLESGLGGIVLIMSCNVQYILSYHHFKYQKSSPKNTSLR